MNLLDSYHALSDEAQRLDSTIQQSQSLHSTTELELSTLRQENTHLKELNHQQKMEIEQVGRCLQQFTTATVACSNSPGLRATTVQFDTLTFKNGTATSSGARGEGRWYVCVRWIRVLIESAGC